MKTYKKDIGLRPVRQQPWRREFPASDGNQLMLMLVHQEIREYLELGIGISGWSVAS